MKKTKPPNKREREHAFVNHNMPRFITSVERVRKAAYRLDCALAECHLYADIIAPFARKGARK